MDDEMSLAVEHDLLTITRAAADGSKTDFSLNIGEALGLALALTHWRDHKFCATQGIAESMHLVTAVPVAKAEFFLDTYKSNILMNLTATGGSVTTFLLPTQVGGQILSELPDMMSEMIAYGQKPFS